MTQHNDSEIELLRKIKRELRQKSRIGSYESGGSLVMGEVIRYCDVWDVINPLIRAAGGSLNPTPPKGEQE